jgi:hypothetical protein
LLESAGSVTPSRLGPASVGKAAALDQEEPGMRIIWDVAPAARIAFTAACTAETHGEMEGKSWGSFMMPNLRMNMVSISENGMMIRLAHDNLAVTGVSLGELGPNARVLGSGWATLIDDLAIPSSIVVLHDVKLISRFSPKYIKSYEVQNDIGTGIQSRLN